jgi:hypothetical protein
MTQEKEPKWEKDLIEKLKVIKTFSEFESLEHQAKTGKAILIKLYPWLEKVINAK